PKQREQVQFIEKAGQHLLELINEVLDIAQIEAGRLKFSLKPVEVSQMLQSALSLVQPLAAQRNLQIIPELPNSDAYYVAADQQRLTQVILNLLSNAIKYNREGGSVTVSCQQPRVGRLRISVSDTGEGIPAEKLERLFVPFDRLDAERRTTVQGSGLGLALSWRLVEAMRGSMGVESTVGQGSTFWVELSLTQAPSQAKAGLADDEPDTVAGMLGVLLNKGR
ncbi:MAG: HAMP domain-containing histidine kinase, partial [Armatimonadota bacterium]|nr:HAMP domain-containing histidine kinase [Armatimonadota bacterium]